MALRATPAASQGRWSPSCKHLPADPTTRWWWGFLKWQTGVCHPPPSPSGVSKMVATVVPPKTPEKKRRLFPPVSAPRFAPRSSPPKRSCGRWVIGLRQLPVPGCRLWPSLPPRACVIGRGLPVLSSRPMLGCQSRSFCKAKQKNNSQSARKSAPPPPYQGFFLVLGPPGVSGVGGSLQGTYFLALQAPKILEKVAFFSIFHDFWPFSGKSE